MIRRGHDQTRFGRPSQASARDPTGRAQRANDGGDPSARHETSKKTFKENLIPIKGFHG